MASTVIVVLEIGPRSKTETGGTRISAVNVVLVKGSSREGGREIGLQETPDALVKLNSSS